MKSDSTPPIAARLGEFYRRLSQALLVGTLEEAFHLVCNTLNAVEDELTKIPYNQETSDTDGRLYPPLWENLREIPGHPNVKRHRHRGHQTYFGANGSFEIADVKTGTVCIAKPGSDGCGVWEV